MKSLNSEIENILIHGFEILGTPRKVTQYLRGELYYYVDSMLSLHLNTTTEELPMIYEFMSNVYLLIQLWMKIFPVKLYK